MPIAVACPSCHARLRVGDQYAGRKVRCPKCSGVIAVSEDEVQTGVTAKATFAAGLNGVGGAAKARAPLPDDDEEPRIRRKARPVDEDEDFEEERPRKKKKKKQKNNGLLIGVLAGGGFLLIGGVVLLIILLTGNKEDTKKESAGGPNKMMPGGGPRDAAKMFGNMPGQMPDAGKMANAGNNPAAGMNLAGTTWVGSETLQDYGRLEFRFLNENQVTMIDAKDTVPGTYTRNGNQITMTFFGGEVTYSGTISGQTMIGTARNPGKTWRWNVKR